MKEVNNIQSWQSWVLAISVLFVLVMVNLAIVDKENHLADGKEVLLELIPVDPRSLMQGDYMRVRFAIEDDIENAFGGRQKVRAQSAYDGAVILSIDVHNIGHFQRIVTKELDSKVNDDNMLVVNFRIREGKIKFATSSFFFQEGKAKYYEKANYGLFKVNVKGEPLLRDLVEVNLES